MRIAIAHDWLCGFRGGEAVLERIAGLVLHEFEPAGLFTMFDEGRPLAPNIDAVRDRAGVTASFLSGGPWSARARRWMLPLYPAAVARLSRAIAAAHARRPIDLLVSTSSAAIKGLAPPPGVPHLCCCFAPARYLWSRGGDYAGGLRGLGLRVLGPRLRAWDRRTAPNVTRFVSISRHIQAEVLRCYGRESSIVFPPARTGFYTPGAGQKREDFWLVAGALEPYKRAELAIEAANRAAHRLVVAGEGSAAAALRRRAGPTVEFRGRVNDAELRDLYRRADVLIFPQVEDYGIVAVEAQACGLPVVAFRAGGALDTVIDGVTGVLFGPQTPEALITAIGRAPRGADAACRANAERFGEEQFDRAFRAEVGAALADRPGAKARTG
ncbi:MAG: glycosyltransferase [Phycisphaerales bacterium]